MLIARSVDGVPVRLTQERWNHICRRHPEVAGRLDTVVETLQGPETILEGDFGEKLAARFYRRTPLTAKHLIVGIESSSRRTDSSSLRIVRGGWRRGGGARHPA